MTTEYNLQALSWKKNEDYTEGLRLFKQRYGESIVYRLLCLGSNDFNREKMLSGIMEGVKEVDDHPEPIKKKDPEASKLSSDVSEIEDSLSCLQSQVDDLEYKLDELTGANLPPEAKPRPQLDDPQEIKEMKTVTYSLMDERTALKQRLRELPDPERRTDRTAAALRILTITEELDILFAKLDYYNDHGRVPEQVVIEPDVIKYPKEYLNLRTYVSRTLKKLQEAKDPKRIKNLEVVLERWRKRMAEIETEL